MVILLWELDSFAVKVTSLRKSPPPKEPTAKNLHDKKYLATIKKALGV